MNDFTNCLTTNVQKMKFSIKNFFGKCVQNRRKLRIWPPLLKKSLIKNFIFCAVYLNFQSSTQIRKSNSRSICNKNSSWKILEELIRKKFLPNSLKYSRFIHWASGSWKNLDETVCAMRVLDVSTI